MATYQLILPGLRSDGRFLTYDEQYEEWRSTEEGTEVYAMVRRLALGMRRRGWRKYGIGALWETARYRLDMARPGDPWKLNNNWRSRMARELMRREPDLAEFFELRELRS